MFMAMLNKIAPLRFNVKYFVHKFSGGKIMKNDEEMKFIETAIDKTAERLDIKYIMERLDDVNKIKKIIFD